jgi:hypothetical protein
MKEYYHRLKDIYNSFINKEDNRRTVVTIAIIYFFLHLILTWAIYSDHLIGLSLLIIAVYIHDNETWSFPLFLISLFFLLITNPITSIVLVGIGLYFLYGFMNERREKRIQKIKQKSPNELSKVSYSDASVEVVIPAGDNE